LNSDFVNDIFISYSLKDSDFCNLLYNDLKKLFNVWIDREGIDGGNNWEIEIEKIIKEVKIVIVVVSKNSLNSKWVRREIQFSDLMGKEIIPILLNSHLPISLMERHFIDFQGEYLSAYSELLESITKLIEPNDKKRDEINRLIGDGIVSYLWRDFQKANNCISQAITLNRSIGSNPADFWNTLSAAFISVGTDEVMADTFSELILFKESCNFNGTYENGVPMYKWSIWLDCNQEVIEKVDKITYYLHETFPNSIQSIRNKSENFKITRLGWGVFTIRAKIVFIDNSEKFHYYRLKFEKRN